ncbi:MAG: CDP-alcohol phosphatidyltransferase family protein [Verrucomicrobiota bacterium]|nr:CDP-alcohol phosphatidyltransferase family protein [Verrucomicrobiota bacterium]
MTTASKLRFVTLLTAARFPLVLMFFIGAVLYERHGGIGFFFMALILLMLSAITDLFDGYFARRFGVVTAFGAYADPLMDKFFYLSTLPLLIFVATKQNHIAHAVALLVLTLFFLTRDQWVSFLRSIGAMYQANGGANWSGKVRTCVNLPLICGIYYYEAAPAHLQFLNPWVVHGFEIIAFVLNAVSGVVYTRQYWPYLRRSADTPDPAPPAEAQVRQIEESARTATAAPSRSAAVRAKVAQ